MVCPLRVLFCLSSSSPLVRPVVTHDGLPFLFFLSFLSLLVCWPPFPFFFSLLASSPIISLAAFCAFKDRYRQQHCIAHQHSFQLSFVGLLCISRRKTNALYIVHAVMCPSSDRYVSRVSFLVVASVDLRPLGMAEVVLKQCVRGNEQRMMYIISSLLTKKHFE